jgi:hypothetical protein
MGDTYEQRPSRKNDCRSGSQVIRRRLWNFGTLFPKVDTGSSSEPNESNPRLSDVFPEDNLKL